MGHLWTTTKVQLGGFTSLGGFQQVSSCLGLSLLQNHQAAAVCLCHPFPWTITLNLVLTTSFVVQRKKKKKKKLSSVSLRQNLQFFAGSAFRLQHLAGHGAACFELTFGLVVVGRIRLIEIQHGLGCQVRPGTPQRRSHSGFETFRFHLGRSISPTLYYPAKFFTTPLL